MRRTSTLIALSFALLGLLGHAAVAASDESAASLKNDGAELLRLNAQRSSLEAQFKAESEVCARRFFVNACLDEAKDKRNAALRPLQEREAAIEAHERRAMAEAQRERVKAREREFAEAEGRHRTAQLLAAPAAASGADTAAPKPAPTPKVSAQNKQLEQQAKSRKAQEEAQRRQVQKASYQSEQDARQKVAQDRQALKEAKGKKSPMPLPIPSAAEIEAAGHAASASKR